MSKTMKALVKAKPEQGLWLEMSGNPAALDKVFLQMKHLQQCWPYYLETI